MEFKYIPSGSEPFMFNERLQRSGFAQWGVKQGCQEIIPCSFAAGLDQCVSSAQIQQAFNETMSATEAKHQRLMLVY